MCGHGNKPNVQFSHSSRTGTEYGLWLNSRKEKHIQYWEWHKKKKNVQKIPVEKLSPTRTLQPRPAYFSEKIPTFYFLAITYPSLRKHHF